MLLNLTNGEPFATGAMSYSYTSVPGTDATSRIILEVEIEGELTTAILDTGAPYTVCSFQLAERLSVDHTNALESTRILIRGEWIRGGIHRINLVLRPREGNGVSLETTAFIPDPEQDFTSDFLPMSFIGLMGCLERIRFAIDPFSDTFYFGPHPSEVESSE